MVRCRKGKKFFSYICNRIMKYLQHIITEGDWQGLAAALDSMSNMELRRAETHIRTTILPSLANNDFWDALLHLINYRRQAFLSGILAIEHLANDGTLDFNCPEAKQLAQTLQKDSPESNGKIINMSLPLLKTEQQIEGLLDTFCTEGDQSRVAALLKVESPQTYYALFTTLRRMPEGKQLAKRCAQFIMKHGNDMAYNMAAIMKAYFGLDELSARFSLHIEPYELSGLDSGNATFYHLLTGRRPNVEI